MLMYGVFLLGSFLTGGTTGGVEGQHGLDGHVHGGDVEGLKHDLGHLLPVGLGVEGGLSEQGGVLLRGHAQLVVEGVVPDLMEEGGGERWSEKFYENRTQCEIEKELAVPLKSCCSA
jgi:hypothetical protein